MEAKNILIGGALFAVVAIVGTIIAGTLAFNWLFDRGTEIAQSGKDTVQAVQKVQPAMTPLNLEAYVANNQVNTEGLVQNFESLPAQLQNIWLKEFQKQLDELKTKAGISDGTIQTLTTLYNTLQLLQ
jgi:hypothetical protein